MGQTIFTPTQHNFLQLAAASEEINRFFFLTGGTALAAFYLQHRLSEDLDFFSENRINEASIDKFMQNTAEEIGAELKKEVHMQIFIYYLKQGEDELKVDFAYRPFRELEFGTEFLKLKVASLWDILLDKFYTILHRVAARDFVDLYFGYREAGCSFAQLIDGLEEKYEIDIGQINIGSRFATVSDLKDYPKMLAPFEKRRMEEFYLDLAKSLEGEIFS